MRGLGRDTAAIMAVALGPLLLSDLTSGSAVPGAPAAAVEAAGPGVSAEPASTPSVFASVGPTISRGLASTIARDGFPARAARPDSCR